MRSTLGQLPYGLSNDADLTLVGLATARMLALAILQCSTNEPVMNVRLCLLLPAIAFGLAVPPARADIQGAPEILAEVAVDIDKDGISDRFVLAQNRWGEDADLYLYLAFGDDRLDLSRKPTFFRKHFVPGRGTAGNHTLESNRKGSLLVGYGWSGSNSWETTVKILYRDGEFVVAGFTKSWDTRESIGSCDINFLSGRGVASRGLRGKAETLATKFLPVKLADWSRDKVPREACDY